MVLNSGTLNSGTMITAFVKYMKETQNLGMLPVIWCLCIKPDSMLLDIVCNLSKNSDIATLNLDCGSRKNGSMSSL